MADAETLNSVQQELLELFKQFIAVCEENNLRYYAIGGTALGAVRHSGFIPWDDDVDVSMPRKDFEELCERVELPDNIRCLDNDDLLYGVFQNLDVRVTHGDSAWDEREPYLSIDIFPLDGTPDNVVLRYLHYIRCWSLFVAIKLKRIAYIQETEGMKNRADRPRAEKILIKYGGILNSVLRGVSEEGLVNRFKKACRSYSFDSSRVAGLFTGRYRIKDFLPHEWYGGGVQVAFCNITVRVYQHVEDYLRQIYGANYLVIPEEDKRERHGSLELVSL